MQRTLTKPAERRRRGRRPHPTRGEQKVVRCDERASNPKDPKPPDRRGHSLFEIVTRPSAGPPQIQHCEDEYFYVLEEDYEFLLEGRTLRADAGCLLYVPKGILHAHKNVGNGVGRMLLTHTPGGLYERFFEEVGKAVDGGARPLSFEGQADAGRAAQIASGYGIEIPQHSTRQRAKIHHRNKAQAGRSTSLPERGGQDYANRHAE